MKVSTTERRIGRYVLLEAIGRGAMGIVYRADDPFIHRTVAVKILHGAMGSTPQEIGLARKRFLREAQSAGGIDHPNIIRILDVGEDQESGEMYIVMEYLPGPSLETMLLEAEVDLQSAVEIIGQIASALDAAHARGIIHRDIKPSNILLTKEGTAKLVDFGITHIVSSSLTQDMGGLGTPAYMSPEQVTGSTIDARADLFSLGVLSYETLSGQRPFQGTDAVSIAYAVAHSEPAPISVVNPQLPRTLDAVLDRALAKRPAKRFANGREFHQALLDCVSTRDDVRSSTPAKISGRRSLVLWGFAGVVLLAAVGFLVSWRGAQTTPRPPTPAAVVKATPARVPVPTATITISLSHRVRRGTLVVSLDGAPIFTERFSTSGLALFQTTTWDPFKAPAGAHKLRARVNADNGKTYLSDVYPVELPRAKATELRVSFKGDALAIKQNSG